MGQIGIINEQGFVMGQGLGYKPINESELKPNEKNNEKKENNK